MICHLPLFLLKFMDMDVRHYFDSVNFSAFHQSGNLAWKYTLGAALEKNTAVLAPENIQKLEVAIVGAPFDSRKETNKSEAPDRIRAHLYTLANLDCNANIVDFGNLKPASSLKGNYQALRDIIDYFNELQVVTIVIGGSQDLSLGICDAFAGDPFFCLSTVDAFLDVKKGKESLGAGNYLSRIFSRHKLFQFSLIGYQGHYVPREYLSKVAGFGPHIRLGELRDDFKRIEPVLRNTDFLSFDTAAIKYSEAPGVGSFSPNGLRGEEACQLAKYAGLSNRLKVFGLFEMNPDSDAHQLTARLSAQIVWYFLEGCANRNAQDTMQEENATRYQVQVKSLDKPLIFLKNNHSGQWWVQVESVNGGTRYFACSEYEYEQAANNEIPELWLKYIQKTDETLK